MDDGYPLPRAMRRLRNLLICAIIERDLSGKADLSEVVETMTRFAEFAIRTHLKTLSEELTARSRYTDRSPFWHTSGNDYSRNGETWGGELNVSSDIDLIFVYPENGETKTTEPGQRPLSNQEFFTRLGKRFIKALSEITEDGFTFRVDMALRPNGESGPLVASTNMVEQYLIVQGREWERYAWIKARPITGNPDDIRGAAGNRASIHLSPVSGFQCHRCHPEPAPADSCRRHPAGKASPRTQQQRQTGTRWHTGN